MKSLVSMINIKLVVKLDKKLIVNVNLGMPLSNKLKLINCIFVLYKSHMYHNYPNICRFFDCFDDISAI